MKTLQQVIDAVHAGREEASKLTREETSAALMALDFVHGPEHCNECNQDKPSTKVQDGLCDDCFDRAGRVVVA